MCYTSWKNGVLYCSNTEHGDNVVYTGTEDTGYD